MLAGSCLMITQGIRRTAAPQFATSSIKARHALWKMQIDTEDRKGKKRRVKKTKQKADNNWAENGGQSIKMCW